MPSRRSSSPESELHVKHTITANGIRQEHTGGLVLSPLHIGLAVGFAIVACLTAFGGGVIVGMWYKASEQGTSLGITGTAPEPASPVPATTSQPLEPLTPATFYNTLTDDKVAYAPLTLPPPAAGSTAESSKAAAVVPSPVKATPRGTTTSELPKQSPAPSAPKAAAAAVTTPPASVKAAAPKPAAPARQPEKATGAQRSASAPALATARGGDDFSVQVGSFGSAEQAERLRTTLAQKGYPVRVQPATVPGQGLRYRVRVGSYADRTAAGQTAQYLTAQEQVPAIVAGKD